MNETVKKQEVLEGITDSDDRQIQLGLLFRKTCSRFPTGVTVTTGVKADGMPFGITISSFTSVSLDPPLVLICIDYRSRALRNLLAGQFFGINVLNENQQEMSLLFAKNSHQQFSEVSWYQGKTGVPLLDDVSASFECKLIDTRYIGDHVIVIGEVLHMVTYERAPLAYVDSRYVRIRWE